MTGSARVLVVLAILVAACSPANDVGDAPSTTTTGTTADRPDSAALDGDFVLQFTAKCGGSRCGHLRGVFSLTVRDGEVVIGRLAQNATGAGSPLLASTLRLLPSLNAIVAQGRSDGGTAEDTELDLPVSLVRGPITFSEFEVVRDIDVALRQIDAAREAWDRERQEMYRLEYRWQCDCPRAGRYTIDVQPNAVTEADGRDIAGMPQSVDELLDVAQQQLELAPHTYRLVFRSDGLPRLLSLGGNQPVDEPHLKYSAIKVSPLP